MTFPCTNALQERRNRRRKRREGEEGEEEIFKIHMKNYRKVVGEKYFLIKAIFKTKYLILNEFQLILNILQFYHILTVFWFSCHMEQDT